MSLFRKPRARKIGLKVLVTGNTGSGKSLFGLTFPNIYALDSEAGLALYEESEKGKNLLGIANTQSFKELENAIKEISKMAQNKDNNIGTMLIDSESKIYQNILETLGAVEENRARRAGRDVLDASISIRSWGKIKQIATKLQNMKIDLSSKGVNVVSVSQVEDIKEKQGDNFVKVGEKPVAAKNIEYDYDIIINLFTDEIDGKTVYKGEIKKDRTGKTQVGDIIENPTFEIWNDKANSKGEIIESNFQEDVSKDIATVESEEQEANETDEDKAKKIVEEIKAKVNSNKDSKEAAKKYLKANGKLTELNIEQLKELLEIVK